MRYPKIMVRRCDRVGTIVAKLINVRRIERLRRIGVVVF